MDQTHPSSLYRVQLLAWLQRKDPLQQMASVGVEGSLLFAEHFEAGVADIRWLVEMLPCIGAAIGFSLAFIEEALEFHLI
jgi:hypothetical protein